MALSGMTEIMLLLVLAFGFAGIVLAVYGAKVRAGMSAVSMYNIAACLIVAAIISGIISFMAVCTALPVVNSHTLSQQDVIVDILGILVTVLMGWNIISVVDIKRNAEKVNTISNDLELVITGMIEMNFHSFLLRKDKETVIDSCFDMLKTVQRCDNKIIRNTAEKEIVEMLKLIKKSYTDGEKIIIYEGKTNEYLFILKQLSGIYTEEIREMLTNAKDEGALIDALAFNREPQNVKASSESNIQFKTDYGG